MCNTAKDFKSFPIVNVHLEFIHNFFLCIILMRAVLAHKIKGYHYIKPFITIITTALITKRLVFQRIDTLAHKPIFPLPLRMVKINFTSSRISSWMSLGWSSDTTTPLFILINRTSYSLLLNTATTKKPVA